MSDDGNNICFSGGAQGADTEFGKVADEVNHRVVHYSFAECKSDVPYRYILTESQLNVADSFLKTANKSLKRRFPTSIPYVNKLLRRNYYQIKDTERVYAIAYIDAARMVEGGTAWAVQMAVDKGVPEIYLYNQYTRQWNQWIAAPHTDKYYWKQMSSLPPRPHGLYTGIGSSKRFTADGKQAIRKLYRCGQNELVRGSERSWSSAK